ncbi:MAG: hypothetical protein BAJALOKI1v1_110013 [Promethearchaeota archaeon]|nr:MAG: hypothetical protein BAJALOKI1v1_110013 [Candidatus Lokiarchaeota archaeon]
MELIQGYCAIELWGLNKRKGTEEAILFLNQEQDVVYDLMKKLRDQIIQKAKQLNAPTSLSIGIYVGKSPSISKISRNSNTELKKDASIFLAYKALKKVKKKEEIVLSCSKK